MSLVCVTMASRRSVLFFTIGVAISIFSPTVTISDNLVWSLRDIEIMEKRRIHWRWEKLVGVTGNSLQYESVPVCKTTNSNLFLCSPVWLFLGCHLGTLFANVMKEQCVYNQKQDCMIVKRESSIYARL